MTIKSKSKVAQCRKIEIDLTGPQGNAFYLLGCAQELNRQMCKSKAETRKLLDEMKSGDYENLVKVFDREFGSIITLLRLKRDEMNGNYPHPCVHCGMCCLLTPCPIAIERKGARPGRPCPYLQWCDDGTGSRCGLAPEYVVGAIPQSVEHVRQLFGFGVGCCIKARAVTVDGEVHDFAGLPGEVKRSLALRLRKMK